MDKKYSILVLYSVILLACIVGSVSASTWYVDDDGGGADFTKIQDAVNTATPGDTIIVSDGTYIENIEVDKSLTIQSETGSDYTVIQAEDPDESIFRVNEDYVNISGFTVKGADTGIYLNYTDQCTISNNNVTGNSAGIYLSRSSENNVSNNIVSNNIEEGIRLSSSYSNIFINNTFINDGFIVLFSYQNTMINNRVNGKPLVYLEDASDYMVEEAGQVILVNCNNVTVKNVNASHTCVGVQLFHTSNSRIINITANWNSQYGIFLGLGSNNNTLMNNTLNSNGQCIRLDSHSNDNFLINNTINSNYNGIILAETSNNLLTKNTANSNKWGINLYYSDYTTITANTVSNNSRYGISLWDSSSNNYIYLNNFINNSDNAYSSDSTNIWNSPTELNYTYNSSTFTNQLGNYWDDLIERYPDAEAIDSAGIWNTPYEIDGDSDEYPLMEPFENYIM
jgi:parallel beta-helix repeat protein